MLYAKAREKTEDERKARDIYVTDALKIISENTAAYGGGKYLTMRYADVISGKIDTRTPDEIAIDVFDKCGLTLGG